MKTSQAGWSQLLSILALAVQVIQRSSMTMFCQPRQIWLLFGGALCIALAGMIWLSMKAVEVDHARTELLVETERARLAAEQQDKVTAVLWRMDSMLTPLIGQEAARPFAMYQPFIPNATATKSVKAEPEPDFIPSPLLRTPSQFVRLHFQIDPQGNWSSPQAPQGPARPMAMACGLSESELKFCDGQLEQFANCISKPQILDQLPDDSLRQYVGEAIELAGGYNSYSNRQQGKNWVTDYGNEVMNQLQSQADNSFPLPDSQRPAQSRHSSSESQNQGANSSPRQQANLSRQQSLEPPPANLRQQSLGPSQQQAEQSLMQSDGEEIFPGRADRDWIQRSMAFDSFANTSFSQQRYVVGSTGIGDGLIKEGVARWIWHDNELILARRVTVNDEVLVQGCWLDWEQLKRQLLEDVSDLMLGIDLRPVLKDDIVEPAFALATMPAQLEIKRTKPVGAQTNAGARNVSSFSPIQMALSLAWIGFTFATIAIGGLLAGVIQLSERRGAFVAAVTHELRTPLTTFRMYAEMLVEGMVQPREKRQVYLETLKAESNRLTHLVENVLSYSRLERGSIKNRLEDVSFGRLVDRIEPRLRERAEQESFEVELHLDDSLRDEILRTDPGAVEQVLFNLVENACKYGTNPDDNRLEIRVGETTRGWSIQVQDNGRGVSAVDRKRLFRPFSKSVERAAETAPGVGLGLALCRRLASAIGGTIQLLDSKQGSLAGACFELRLPKA